MDKLRNTMLKKNVAYKRKRAFDFARVNNLNASKDKVLHHMRDSCRVSMTDSASNSSSNTRFFKKE